MALYNKKGDDPALCDTGDPSDFTLYTSDITDIAVQSTEHKEETPSTTVAPRTSNSDQRYSQVCNSNFTGIFSNNSIISTQGQVILPQNVLPPQSSDILMQHGLPMQGNVGLPPMNLWDPNLMGLEYPLLGINEVMMNTHLLPPMPSYSPVTPMLHPDLIMPKPVIAQPDLNLPRHTTPISAPIDCTSCKVHPPSRGCSRPLVQKKPPACRTIFVGGIPKNTSRVNISDIFKRFGKIIDIRMNSRFCHIRFDQEESVEAALSFSGCRVTIGNSQHNDDSGLIFVDYSKCKEDLRDWEIQQKTLMEKEKSKNPSPPSLPSTDKESIRQNNTFPNVVVNQQEKSKNPSPPCGRYSNDRELILANKKVKQNETFLDVVQVNQQEKSRIPSPPCGPYCNDKELMKANKNIKQNDTFLDVVQVLKLWLDKGECDKKNIDRIYYLIVNANGHVKRLNNERNELVKELMDARDKCKEKVKSISSQLSHIEGLFVSASQQKVWDHFSKAQRKNLDEWKRELKKHRKAGPHNQSVLTKEKDDMDLSDEEKQPNDEKYNDLAKENIRLKHQLDAARKQMEAFRMEQIKEEKLKDELVDKMETTLKLFKEESKKAETKIRELKNAHQSMKKAHEEFSKMENTKISKLEEENNDLKQQLTMKQEEHKNISSQLTNIKTERDLEKNQLVSQIQGQKTQIAELNGMIGSQKKHINELLVNKNTIEHQLSTARQMFNFRETKLIGIISAFLVMHPQGVDIDAIAKNSRKLDDSVQINEIRCLMDKCRHIFKFESSKGWTINASRSGDKEIPTIPLAGSETNEKTPEHPHDPTRTAPEPNEEEPSQTEIEMSNEFFAIKGRGLKRLKNIYDHWSTEFERRSQEFRQPTEPLKVKQKPKQPSEAEQTLAEVEPPFSSKEEEERIFRILSRCRSPISWSLQLKKFFNEIRPASLPKDAAHHLKLTSTNGIIHIDIPPLNAADLSSIENLKVPEYFLEEITAERCRLYNTSMRTKKRLTYLAQSFRYIPWSDEFIRWVQDFRYPHEPLENSIRRRLNVYGKLLTVHIPAVTPDHLAWLRDNVPVSEKFPEEKILEQLGLLPDYSDDYEDKAYHNRWFNVKTIRIVSDSSGNTTYKVSPSIQDSCGENSQAADNQESGDSQVPLEANAVTDRKNVRPNYSIKEIQRLRHIFLNFEDVVWSKEFMRRMQDFRDPNTCPKIKARRGIKISPEEFWSFSIPRMNPQKLAWLRDNIQIPDKYPEELILESRGGLIEFSDDDDMDILGDVEPSKVQPSANENSSILPFESNEEKKRLRHIEMNFDSLIWSPEFMRRIQDLRSPNMSPSILVRKKVKMSGGPLWWFTIPAISLEYHNWLKENVSIPDKYPEEFIMEENGIYLNSSEDVDINDDVITMSNGVDTTSTSTQKEIIDNFLLTPEGLVRLYKVLGVFCSWKQWSPELRKVLETFRPVNCFKKVKTKLRTPDGKLKIITLPPLNPEALEEINKVTVEEKLPEEFIIEELSGVPASVNRKVDVPPRKVFNTVANDSVIVEESKTLSGKKRKLTGDEYGESPDANRDDIREVKNRELINSKDQTLNKNIESFSEKIPEASSPIHIKTEPVETMKKEPVDDDHDGTLGDSDDNHPKKLKSKSTTDESITGTSEKTRQQKKINGFKHSQSSNYKDLRANSIQSEDPKSPTEHTKSKDIRINRKNQYHLGISPNEKSTSESLKHIKIEPIDDWEFEKEISKCTLRDVNDPVEMKKVSIDKKHSDRNQKKDNTVAVSRRSNDSVLQSTNGKKRKINDNSEDAKRDREHSKSTERKKARTEVNKSKDRSNNKQSGSEQLFKGLKTKKELVKQEPSESGCRKYAELSEDSLVIRSELDQLFDNSSFSIEELCDTYWSSEDLQRHTDGKMKGN